MPATGDRITKRKDGLSQGMYMAQTPDDPKRKYIYGRKFEAEGNVPNNNSCLGKNRTHQEDAF